MAILGDNKLVDSFSSTVTDHAYYKSKGVYLKTITNYYSKAITQYYIQDINA
jgi:hypothetical protein